MRFPLLSRSKLLTCLYICWLNWFHVFYCMSTLTFMNNWPRGAMFYRVFFNVGHLVNLSISPVCDVKISYWHSWWATNWCFSIDIWNVCFIIEKMFFLRQIVLQKKKKKNNISFFVQVEFGFNFLLEERPFRFKFSSVDCFLKKLDGLGGWYTSLQTCLWSVRVRFSELNVAKRLHLRPGWKDYSVSIFINPGPFPSLCSRLPWEAFIYRELSLSALHYIFIFNCLLQLTDSASAFNTQCSTLLVLNGRKLKLKQSAFGCWRNIRTQYSDPKHAEDADDPWKLQKMKLLLIFH